MKTVLTIAGSDSGGGAGIQADLKTMLSNGVYGMSVITALTAQNTLGVSAISEVPPDFVAKEIDAVFEDIFPDAVKIGMVSSEETIVVISDRLKHHKAVNIVVDPVMVSTSGSRLLSDGAENILVSGLFSVATLVTPNIPEAQALTNMSIVSEDDMVKAALVMHEKYGCSVLLKGGHSINDANDVLCHRGECLWFKSPKVDNPNTHGTGCTLSSAIASNLAKGFDVPTSVGYAKDYICGALNAKLNLGRGSGPLDHGFDIKSEFKSLYPRKSQF